MMNVVWTSIAASTAIALASGMSLPARGRAVANCPYCIADGGRPDTLVANPQGSSIRWSGTKLARLGRTEGSAALTGGELVLRHGALVSGNFTVDMRHLEVSGAPRDSASRRATREQLMSASVFDVAQYPTATFAARSMSRTGNTTWSVTGDLTLHGVTRPVTFITEVSWPETGHMLATTAFTVDRRAFGIDYGGSGVANALGDSDLRLSITLDARRRGTTIAER